MRHAILRRSCSTSARRMPTPFSVKVDVKDSGPGLWKTARVDIFEGNGGTSRQIGSYERNHSGWCDSTFAPFVQNGRWFALYAPDYTATRVMELPSCKDLGGEEPHSHGFCPVDYYVPYDHGDVEKAGDAGRFGFVAGCIWGDDSSWKIQYLDLAKVAAGVIVRKEMFGYIEMPRTVSRLEECISLDGYSRQHPFAELVVSLRYDLAKGARVDPFE
jgi:hypothetical protein